MLVPRAKPSTMKTRDPNPRIFETYSPDTKITPPILEPLPNYASFLSVTQQTNQHIVKTHTKAENDGTTDQP